MLIGDTRRSLTVCEFLVGFLTLLLAVLFIFYGFSLRAVVKPQSVTTPSQEFEKCFDIDVRDHLVDGDLRVVLMVIDAWRMSFLAEGDSPMTFLRQSISSGRAVAFTANAQTPTVTMPRIKALTSGVVPSLVSLLGNFFASESMEDSWVSSASSAGRRIAFFGDDTWLRLFPNAFVKAEGVTSFFVNDFTEVDNNVTRHLDSLLKSRDWDVLILHYLGLDHVGHSLGGQSPEIKRKLKEMDEIARRIFDVISVQSPLLLVAVGDHGMTNAGSHGGGSEAETRVPMVFVHSKASIVQPGDINGLQSAEQVDLASTLPFFLRTPIPSGSVGLSLIPQLASQWLLSDATVFSAAFQSAVHFSKFTDDSSVLALSDVHGDERCRVAKTFASHARGRLAMEENRQAQRRIIESQEQTFRWPIFISLALLAVGFISLSGAYEDHMHGTLKSRTESDASELPDKSAYLIFLLYHFSSYSTSLIEEEHDIWYYISSTVVLYQMFLIMRGSTKTRSVLEMFRLDTRLRSAFILLCLHRWAMSFTSYTRRRWSMREDVLPPPILPEFQFHLRFLDYVIKNLNLSLFANWMPFSTTVLCVVYFLSRVRPKNKYGITTVSIYAVSLAICLQTLLDDSGGQLIIYFIIGGVLITLMSSIPLAGTLYLSYLVRLETLPLLLISFEMGIRARKMSCSPYLFAFLCQTVFFYTGQSSNISSIDIAVGYKGLSSYIVPLVAFQIFTNFYASPICFSLGYFLNQTSQQIGQTEEDDRGVLVLASVLQLRSLMLFSAIVSMICLSGHLFTFSVLAPKMICEVLHSIIALLITGAISLLYVVL